MRFQQSAFSSQVAQIRLHIAAGTSLADRRSPIADR